MEGIKEAVKRGFRVTTNATFFDGTDPNNVRGFFDEVMAMGVEGIVLSPGYSYENAPDQNRFLGRARVRRLFRAILSNRKPTWKFNMSPLFLEFLMGDRKYECTPWGSPAYNIFGWQTPLLSPAGRLRRELQGTARDDQVGRVRCRQRQSQVRELHGELRLRADGSHRRLRLSQGHLGHDSRHVQHV